MIPVHARCAWCGAHVVRIGADSRCPDCAVRHRGIIWEDATAFELRRIAERVGRTPEQFFGEERGRRIRELTNFGDFRIAKPPSGFSVLGELIQLEMDRAREEICREMDREILEGLRGLRSNLEEERRIFLSNN